MNEAYEWNVTWSLGREYSENTVENTREGEKVGAGLGEFVEWKNDGEDLQLPRPPVSWLW